MLELNKIYCEDCRDTMARMENKSVDMIIADPPYYRIKGEFDFIYKNFDEYLTFLESCVLEFKRILKERGTFFIYGHAKKIAYTQVICDKYFGLINNLVWEKAEKDGMYGTSGSDNLRSFPNSTERILMYSNDVYNLTQCVYEVRDYIRSEIIRAKGKIKLIEVNKALGTAINGGGVASACLSLNKSEPAMFTKEMYEKLQIWLNDSNDSSDYEYLRSDYEDLRSDYEDLRSDYEDLRRTFNNYTNSTEVLKFRFKPSLINHDTVKSEELTRVLINTCSNKGDLIYIPFVGSGTECTMAIKEDRNFVGSEIEKKYVDIATERMERERMQLRLAV